MTVAFTSIKIEVQIGGEWIDLTADVRQTPFPAVTGIGIMSNNPLDRVGNVSSFSFSLDNSASNSALTRGYYSPGATTALPGWRPGLYVRFYCEYDGWSKGLFYGRIDADGITVTPGIYSTRDVQVRASGWMREASDRSLELTSAPVNQRSDTAVGRVVDNMPVAPLVESYRYGNETFPVIFDVTGADTKAAGEFEKIANSEFGFIYVRGDRMTTTPGGETLAFDNRKWRYAQRNEPTLIPKHSTTAVDHILMETDDAILCEDDSYLSMEHVQEATFTEAYITDMEVSYGRHLCNRARLTSYPRKVDATAVVLWNLEKPLIIRRGETLRGVRGAYRDPSGKSSRISADPATMIAPVATTDYLANSQEDGGGSNLTASLSVSATYFTSEVQYNLTNNASQTLYVTFLQARGYGVYTYDTTSVLYESVGSMEDYGVHQQNFDLPYIRQFTNLFSTAQYYDRLLMETGDKILTEDDQPLWCDDTAGIFDTLVYDQPEYYIESVELWANRDQFNALAFMGLDAGSFIYISETVTGIAADYTYCINGYDVELRNGRDIYWKPTLVSSLRFPRI